MSVLKRIHEVPHVAALLSPEYPQFTRVVLPNGSDAESAWVGEVQPFSSDIAARAFLHDVEARRTIWVSSGRIQEKPAAGVHWADPLLISMSVCCKLLILVQPAPAHPRAYLLDPHFPEHYSVTHPHPRADLIIEWNGRRVPGLCVYSAAEFTFEPLRDRNSQFLDQATLYVARHLIWLRTRQLFRGFPPTGILLRAPLPGEQFSDDRPVVRQAATGRTNPVVDYWRGYWPGATAVAFDAATHLRKIKATQECWCGTGFSYGACHRDRETAAVKENKFATA